MDELFLGGLRGIDATDQTEVLFVAIALAIVFVVVIAFGWWWNH